MLEAVFRKDEFAAISLEWQALSEVEGEVTYHEIDVQETILAERTAP